MPRLSFLTMPAALSIWFVAGTLLLSASSSSAAVMSFSGGSGAPIRFTIAAPISYTVTSANSGFLFVFKGVGDLIHTASPGDGPVYPTNVVSTLTYSRNGGTAQPINFFSSGFVGGSYVKDDLYFAKDPPESNPVLVPGDVVTLNAGTLTTTDNFDASLPAGGSFTTYLYANAQFGEPGDSQISNAGVQAPEPSTLCGLGAIGWLAVARGRRPFRRSQGHV